MKRMRQISDKWTEDDVKYLSQYGIKVKTGKVMLFEIEEGENYNKVRKYLENKWKNTHALSYRDIFFINIHRKTLVRQNILFSQVTSVVGILNLLRI